MDELNIEPVKWMVVAILLSLGGGLVWLLLRYARNRARRERDDFEPMAEPVRPPASIAAGGMQPAEALDQVGDAEADTTATEPTTETTAPQRPVRRFSRELPGAEVRDLDANSDDLPDFFNELEILFRQTLLARPEQIDVRLKLLEICHAVGDVDKFISEAMVIRDLMKGNADDRWDAVMLLGGSLLPAHPLFDGKAGTALSSIGRHYDVLNNDRAHPVLNRLKAQYQELRQHSDDYPLMQELLDMLGDPSPLEELPRAGAGARILVKCEARPGFEPIYINARAQVLIAGRLGYRKLVTAARSEAHARAFNHGIRRAKRKLSGQLYFDDLLVSRDTGLAAELGSAKVEVHLPPYPQTARKGDTDARVVALDQFVEEDGQMFYVSDLGGGPAPYPQIIRNCQAAIGIATGRQLRAAGCEQPAAIVCCYESGQAAVGLLVPYLDRADCAMYCSKPYAHNRDSAGDELAESMELRSAREHAWLQAAGRVEYREIADDLAMAALAEHAELAAGENAYANGRALALALEVAAKLPATETVLLMLAPAERLGGDAFRNIKDAEVA